MPTLVPSVADLLVADLLVADLLVADLLVADLLVALATGLLALTCVCVMDAYSLTHHKRRPIQCSASR